MTKLTVAPLTRVEGNGQVVMTVGRAGLEDVKVRLIESPRLFEAMVVGRRYDEVPDLVCRICAICSAVHKLTSLAALEKSQTIAVPPLAQAIRELLLLGGHIQSHALHLFCLVLPDFDGAQCIVDLLKRHDPLSKAGLALKAFGNFIQEIAGGRVIHPVNPVFGGVVYRPEPAILERLLSELDDWQARWPGLAEDYLTRARYPAAMPVRGRPLATGMPDAFGLHGDRLWSLGGDNLPLADYAEYLEEKTVDFSHARQAMGQRGPFMVGALARVRLATERGCGEELFAGRDDIHANNAAQISEVAWALNRTRRLVEGILATERDSPLRAKYRHPQAGVGTAAMEAPRGTLIHHYIIDEWGQVAVADIVTPTAINQLAMAEQIMTDLAGETDASLLQDTAEKIIRSFDPCISCAVHLLQT
jgi:sulfhydrogenase subunit alpha